MIEKAIHTIFRNEFGQEKMHNCKHSSKFSKTILKLLYYIMLKLVSIPKYVGLGIELVTLDWSRLIKLTRQDSRSFGLFSGR